MKHRFRNEVKGEMTVFLSLLFIIFISFTGSILESASLQGLKSERRADMSLAMDSVFAEYQSRLFEKYHVFALDASYESGSFDEAAIGKRLNFYAGTDAEQEIMRMQLLTDDCGQAFYEQAVRWMETDIGNGLLEKIPQMEELWKEQDAVYENREEEMDQALAEAGEVLPPEDNPFQDIIEMRSDNFLSKVMPPGAAVSEKTIKAGEMPSGRSLKTGRGEFKEQVLGNRGVSDILFGEYLLKHFSHAVKKGEPEGGLAYEMEYILEGTDSDAENLTRVLRKIQMMRVALNYSYLVTDQEKCQEAQTWAAALSVVLMMPEMTEVLKHTLLLVWSYKEAVADLRTLLEGKKCAFWKTKENWKTGFSSVLLPDQRQETKEDSSGGIGYEDYLRMFYTLKSKTEMRMRSIDMVESNLRQGEGLEFFFADQCVSRLEIKTTCRFRRGITYSFQNYYEYR